MLPSGMLRQVPFELEIPAMGVAIDQLMEPMQRGISVETLFDQAVCQCFAPIGEVALLPSSSLSRIMT